MSISILLHHHPNEPALIHIVLNLQSFCFLHTVHFTYQSVGTQTMTIRNPSTRKKGEGETGKQAIPKILFPFKPNFIIYSTSPPSQPTNLLSYILFSIFNHFVSVIQYILHTTNPQVHRQWQVGIHPQERKEKEKYPWVTN